MQSDRRHRRLFVCARIELKHQELTSLVAVVGGEPVSRLLELLKPVVSLADLTERIAHRALQQTIVKLEFVVRREHADVIGRGQEPDETSDRGADLAVQITCRDRARPAILSRLLPPGRS